MQPDDSIENHPALAVEEIARYDLRGLNCPLPVLKARKRLAALPPRTQLWLETTDPLAVIDIPAFLAEDGHRLVMTESVEGGHRFLVEAGQPR